MVDDGTEKATGVETAGAAGRRLPRRRALLVLSAAAVLLAAIGLGAAALRAGPPENGAAVAAALGLSADHRCGTATAVLAPSPGAAEVEVFALDRTWHWVAQCLEDVLAAARKGRNAAAVDAFLDAQVRYVLSRPRVRFYRPGEEARHALAEVSSPDGRPDPSRFDRLVWVNDHGVAHNAMSQAALGGWFLEAARASAERGDRSETAALYEALGLATLRVILDDVAEGGLRSRGECSLKPGRQCSWFHAVTDPKRPSPRAGATLNKHLIVVLGLHSASRALRRLDAAAPRDGRLAIAGEFSAAAAEGLDQLAYGEGHRKAGGAPNLFDYIARDPAGAPIADSWLFYGLNPEKSRGGYYLGTGAYRNCHYHILDMRLLRRALNTVGKDADLAGFTRHDDWLGNSLAGFIVEAYDRKLASGLFEDSATAEGGNYAGCKRNLFDPADFEEVRAYFHDLAGSRS